MYSYTHISARYRFIATLVPNLHCGCITLFYQESPNFSVEAICQFGANIIAFQLTTGERC